MFIYSPVYARGDVDYIQNQKNENGGYSPWALQKVRSEEPTAQMWTDVGECTNKVKRTHVVDNSIGYSRTTLSVQSPMVESQKDTSTEKQTKKRNSDKTKPKKTIPKGDLSWLWASHSQVKGRDPISSSWRTEKTTKVWSAWLCLLLKEIICFVAFSPLSKTSDLRTNIRSFSILNSQGQASHLRCWRIWTERLSDRTQGAPLPWIPHDNMTKPIESWHYVDPRKTQRFPYQGLSSHDCLQGIGPYLTSPPPKKDNKTQSATFRHCAAHSKWTTHREKNNELRVWQSLGGVFVCFDM